MALIVESRPPSDFCTGYFQISSGTAAFAVTAPAGSRWARLTVEIQTIRYRLDGVVPTTAVGTPMVSGQSRDIGLSDWTKFNGIPVTSGGILNVEFFGGSAPNT